MDYTNPPAPQTPTPPLTSTPDAGPDPNLDPNLSSDTDPELDPDLDPKLDQMRSKGPSLGAIVGFSFFLIIGHIAAISLINMSNNPELPDDTETSSNSSSDYISAVAGTWNCFDYNRAEETNQTLILTLELKSDSSFRYGPYGYGLAENHYGGSYTINSEPVKQETADYYSLSLSVTEYTDDGIDKNIPDIKLSSFSMGISNIEDDRQAIINSSSPEQVYYCYESK